MAIRIPFKININNITVKSGKYTIIPFYQIHHDLHWNYALLCYSMLVYAMLCCIMLVGRILRLTFNCGIEGNYIQAIWTEVSSVQK